MIRAEGSRLMTEPPRCPSISPLMTQEQLPGLPKLSTTSVSN